VTDPLIPSSTTSVLSKTGAAAGAAGALPSSWLIVFS
jgi:hypothetical protein